MNPNYPPVAQRARHNCEYCHAPEVIFNVAFEVDRIIPIAKGGLDDLQNLALACRICNLRKFDYVDGVDPVTQQQARLFNPRTDIWEDHFAVQQQPPFYLEAKTSIGRCKTLLWGLTSNKSARGAGYNSSVSNREKC